MFWFELILGVYLSVGFVLFLGFLWTGREVLDREETAIGFVFFVFLWLSIPFIFVYLVYIKERKNDEDDTQEVRA